MYYITKELDLVGKRIAFTHFAQFADKLTIVTDDGGIMVVEVEGYENEKETFICLECRAKDYIMKDKQKWMIKELNKIGVITSEDLEEYNKEKQQRLEKQRLQMELDQEKRDKENYERLKLKFEQNKERSE